MTDDDTVTVELPEQLYSQYRELKGQAEKIKKELALVDECIRIYIDAEAKGYNADVTYSGQSVGSYTRVDSLRLDTNKLRTEQPSVYDAYVKPATTWRLAWSKGEA